MNMVCIVFDMNCLHYFRAVHVFLGFWLSCPAVMNTRQATRVTLVRFLVFSGFWGNVDRRKKK